MPRMIFNAKSRRTASNIQQLNISIEMYRGALIPVPISLLPLPAPRSSLLRGEGTARKERRDIVESRRIVVGVRRNLPENRNERKSRAANQHPSVFLEVKN
jgi:hypothetical protein